MTPIREQNFKLVFERIDLSDLGGHVKGCKKIFFTQELEENILIQRCNPSKPTINLEMKKFLRLCCSKRLIEIYPAPGYSFPKEVEVSSTNYRIPYPSLNVATDYPVVAIYSCSRINDLSFIFNSSLENCEAIVDDEGYYNGVDNTEIVSQILPGIYEDMDDGSDSSSGDGITVIRYHV
ncbi:Hypothetical predicted protein [Octopus vulgaris]|uniref:Uncharacterized protein n=1 Tax=Octopus vulgaris TaxID=6645 RepID=A0AA36B0Z4_OCTVU|nr:Hypothetical predicted protein [Octopus vulgaris]